MHKRRAVWITLRVSPTGVNLFTMLLCEVLDSWQPDEIRILRPKSREVSLRGCQHHAVSHSNAVLDGQPCSLQRRRAVEVYNLGLLHDGDCSKGLVLATLLAYALEYFKQGQRGYDERLDGLYGSGKCRGVGSVSKVLEPSRGIDYVHTRSGSRGTSVLIPLRDPRAAFIARTGTSSIRPRYSIACSRSPGLMPSASRIFLGITI